QVFLVLHGAFLILDKHLVNQSWRVKLSYAAVSSRIDWDFLLGVVEQHWIRSKDESYYQQNEVLAVLLPQVGKKQIVH
ncbi:hypothetical protein, partial [Vibrio litoralis]|uniref:hypothetical protein n=1 Tax=Vibrio litoralis TaxID=335972 RepID=UPI001D0450DD